MLNTSRTMVNNSCDGILCIDLDIESESHLFRHASEITRETKGGYLKGRISVPKCSKPFYLRLSLTPAEPDQSNNEFCLHPNLLHINLRQNKKNRNLQVGELPDDVDWAFVFRVDPDGNVSRVTSCVNPAGRFASHSLTSPESANTREALLSENALKMSMARNMADNFREQTFSLGPLRVPEYSNVKLQQVTVIKDDRFLVLGSSGLMLNVITPLQKFSKGGTTLSDVLQQRFVDLFKRPMSQALSRQVEESFTGKKDKVKLQRVCLLAEMFGCDSELPFQKSGMSQIITNSKSKECGPLHIHDINPSASCYKSRTKIFILSSFKLVTEVKAAFVLWNTRLDKSENDRLLADLNQPEECEVFNQNVVICFAPAQNWRVIQAIKAKGLEIRLCAFRPSDKRMSTSSFRFEYLPHVHYDKETCLQGPSGTVCGSCYIQPYSELKEKLPLAKPGWQRRKHNANTVPEQVNTRVNSSKNNAIADAELIIDAEQDIQVKAEPYEVAMDLSLHRPVKRVINMKEEASVPPKKRVFIAQTPSSSNFHDYNHLTLPAPPRRPT